ncbi:MAG: hypothetical protein ACFFD4_27585, partial [Candidatus Odinarchaeota archaeon]
ILLEAPAYILIISSNIGWIAAFLLSLMTIPGLSVVNIRVIILNQLLLVSGAIDLIGFAFFGLSAFTKVRFSDGSVKKRYLLRAALIVSWILVTLLWRISTLLANTNQPFNFLFGLVLPAGLSILIPFTTIYTWSSVMNIYPWQLVVTMPMVTMLMPAFLLVLASMLLSALFIEIGIDGFDMTCNIDNETNDEKASMKARDRTSVIYGFLNASLILILVIMGLQVHYEFTTMIAAILIMVVKGTAVPVLGVVIMRRAYASRTRVDRLPHHVKEFHGRIKKLFSYTNIRQMLRDGLLVILLTAMFVIIILYRDLLTHLVILIDYLLELLVLTALFLLMVRIVDAVRKSLCKREKVEVSISICLVLVVVMGAFFITSPPLNTYGVYPETTITVKRDFPSTEAKMALESLELMDLSSKFVEIPVHSYSPCKDLVFVVNETFNCYQRTIETAKQTRTFHTSTYRLIYEANVSYHHQQLTSDNLSAYITEYGYFEPRYEGWWNGSFYEGIVETESTVFQLVDDFNLADVWIITSSLEYTTSGWSYSSLVTQQVTVLDQNYNLLYIAIDNMKVVS